jgi:hypothetical protein
MIPNSSNHQKLKNSHGMVNQALAYIVVKSIRRAVRHRKTMCFLTVFLVTCLAYGQAEKERFDLPEIYPARLAEHLSPNIDTLVAHERALFYAKPSFNPEYSIRIVERGNQSYIEGRFLEKNLWYELFERFMRQDIEPFSVNVSLNSMAISKKIKERMLVAFNNLIYSTKAIDNCEMVQFDGISYVFILFDKNQVISTIEARSPKPGTIENDIANLFTQIARDLKSQSFDEEKYSALF